MFPGGTVDPEDRAHGFWKAYVDIDRTLVVAVALIKLRKPRLLSALSTVDHDLITRNKHTHQLGIRRSRAGLFFILLN